MNKLALSSLILSLLSFDASAETPSFNYIEIGYTDSLSSDDFDGYEFKASFELNDSFYLSADYQSESASTLIDLEEIFLGIGYKNQLSDSSVWFTQIDYARIESDIILQGIMGSFTNEGYQLSVGVKSNVTKNWELSASAKYNDILESDTFVELGTVYNFSDNAGLYFDVETDLEDTEYGIGFRFSF
jgi:outer membrane protein with beta-barrel domain